MITDSALRDYQALSSRKQPPERLTDEDLLAEYKILCRIGNNTGSGRRNALLAVITRRGLNPTNTPPPPVEQVIDGMLHAVEQALGRPGSRRRRIIRVPEPSEPVTTSIREPSPDERIRQIVEQLGRQGFPNLGTLLLRHECTAKVLQARDWSEQHRGEVRVVFTFGKDETATWNDDPDDTVLPPNSRAIARITDGEVTFVSGTRRR